jgi:hypothetical protein
MRLLLLVSCLALIPVSYGQKSKDDGADARISTRSIQGRVLTKAGAPVSGAVVLIKDSKTLQVRSYIAQADGQYHFFGLNTDVNYDLRAENQGLTSKVKTVSVFDSHKVVKLDLKLVKDIVPAKAKK